MSRSIFNMTDAELGFTTAQSNRVNSMPIWEQAKARKYKHEVNGMSDRVTIDADGGVSIRGNFSATQILAIAHIAHLNYCSRTVTINVFQDQEESDG